MMTSLLTDTELESSSIVANCRMNRERELTGGNGYQRELGLHSLDFLRSRASGRWLDLCCGTARALFVAADLLDAAEDIHITGIDLMDMFWRAETPPRLRLVATSLHTWQTDERFDLITCVHGLHYLGDKLGVIAKAVSWLSDDGVFVANLDDENVRDEHGKSFGRRLPRWLREAGLEYDTRRHRVTCHGGREVRFALQYVGADDAAGPNYTGQSAVHSRYRLVTPKTSNDDGGRSTERAL